MVTLELIKQVLNNENSGKSCIPSDEVLGYFRELLTSFESAVNLINTVEEIKDWVKTMFPDDRHFTTDIISTPSYDALNRITPLIHDLELKRKLTVETARQAIILGLLMVIFNDTNLHATIEYSALTPWTIKTALLQKKNMGKLFGVATSLPVKIPEKVEETTSKAKKQVRFSEDIEKGQESQEEIEEYVSLPVTVTINGHTFVHEMNYHLVLGIIAGYHSLNLPVEEKLLADNGLPEGIVHPLSLYGGKLRGTTSVINNMLMKAINYQSGYDVKVNSTKYHFYDIHFLRGLITAAQWIMKNNEPHKYIRKIMEHKLPISDDGIPLFSAKPEAVAMKFVI